MERKGSIIGFSDPLAPPCVAPFTACAVKQSVVLAISISALKRVIYGAEEGTGHALSLTIQRQHNLVLESLKAPGCKSYSVTRRASQVRAVTMP